MFEYDSEEIAYLRDLLNRFMGVKRDTKTETDIIMEAHDYLIDVGVADCSGF